MSWPLLGLMFGIFAALVYIAFIVVFILWVRERRKPMPWISRLSKPHR